MMRLFFLRSYIAMLGIKRVALEPGPRNTASVSEMGFKPIGYFRWLE